MEPEKKTKNIALQGLRGLGAVTVFLWHTDHVFSQFLPVSPTLLFRGDFANPLFFLLAGFFGGLFYHPDADPKKQVLKKLKRIYPLYFITLLVELCYLVLSQFIKGGLDLLSLLPYLPHLFLLQSWIPNYSLETALNGPAWFLSVMLFLWVLNAPAASFLTKMVHKGTRSALQWFAGIFVIFTAGTWLIDACGLIPLVPEILRPYNWCPYVMGMLLGLLLQNGTVVPESTRKVSAIDSATLLAFAAALVLRQVTVRTVSFSVFILLASVLILRLYLCSEGFLSRLFSQKHLVFLGNRSMEFYLLHVPTLEITLKFTQIVFKGSLQALGGILALVITFFATLAEAYIWEHWLQKKLVKLF